MTKGMLQEHNYWFNLGIRAIDLALIISSGLLAFFLYTDAWDLPKTHYVALIISGLLTVIIFPMFDLYRAWRGAPISVELRSLIIAWITLFVTLFTLAFLTQTVDLFPLQWTVSWYLIGMGLLISFRVTLRQTLRYLRSKGRNQKKIILAGCSKVSDHVVRELNKATWTGIQVIGVFGDDVKQCEERGLYRLGAFADIPQFVYNNDVDQVWLCLPLSAEEKLQRVMHDLRHSTADLIYVPDIFGFQLLNHSFSEVSGIPVVNLTSSPLSGLNRLAKDVFDRLFALCVLTVISPLLLAIAIGVRISSPGPIVFKQLRHGWDGHPIRVYKFRTMKMHHEEHGKITQATKDDPRITSFGSFLRRTSLDELPQFFNVLQGRMSIVGPRPHAIEHNEFYKDQVDRYMLRHKVKPGITGWAQVNGYRGETDTVYKMKKRVEYDLYYIEHWSLWMDIKIIFFTMFNGFVNKNAY